MPNLILAQKLRSQFGDEMSELKISDLELILESFDPNRIGGQSSYQKTLTKAFSFDTDKADKYIDYFLQRKKTDVVLLFIDITSFSQRFASKSADDLASYLDDYYRRVIRVVYEHGGEIEKIIGDGIICVFGAPFLFGGRYKLHSKADACARKIIRLLRNTTYECKIAFHYGEVMYYQNDVLDDYHEYTIIGNTLTHLFRLESISKPNSINYFSGTYYDILREANAAISKRIFTEVTNFHWKLKGPIEISQIEVPYSIMKYLEYSSS